MTAKTAPAGYGILVALATTVAGALAGVTISLIARAQDVEPPEARAEASRDPDADTKYCVYVVDSIRSNGEDQCKALMVFEELAICTVCPNSKVRTCFDETGGAYDAYVESEDLGIFEKCTIRFKQGITDACQSCPDGGQVYKLERQKEE